MRGRPASGPRAVTAEELLELPDDEWRHELVNGELRTLPLNGFEHGVVALTVGGRLDEYVNRRGLGVVVAAGTGFVLSRDPDTVLAPDAAFVAAERVPPPDQQDGFAELASDLAVEVVSPSDRAVEVTE